MTDYLNCVKLKVVRLVTMLQNHNISGKMKRKLLCHVVGKSADNNATLCDRGEVGSVMHVLRELHAGPEGWAEAVRFHSQQECGHV